MTEEILNETTGELLPAVVSRASRTVDMRDKSTDSWTDVLDDAITLARGVAGTEFVPKGLRGSVEKVTAAVLYSRELGLPPMTGLGATHVIEGKAGISAEMMRALVLQAGHELAIKESSRERCEIWGRRKGSEEWTKSVWTIGEAGQTQVFISKEKGWQPLSSKATWRSWPTEMLLARATTRLVRMIFPDVAHGMRSVEELQDMQVEESSEVVQAPPVAAPVARKRAAVRKPAAAAPVAPVVEASEAEPAEEAQEAQEEAQEPPKPAPVARARAPRPAPRTAPPAAAPEPSPTPAAEPVVEAETDTLPEEPAEVVEAEVVDEQAPVDLADKRRRAGTIVIVKHFERLGVSDRPERLWLTSEFAGRKCESSNDLTDQEVRDLASILERSKDLAALQASIDKRRVER